MGRVLVLDATRSDTLAPSHLYGTNNSAGAACEAAEKAKANKYRGLGSEYEFVPFSVETIGPWGPSSRRLFKETAKRFFGLATSANVKTFPRDFEFGAATSSYQIEGAWNVDGKGWSMWDHLVRTDPEFIFDNTTGDIAANSYYLYKRDVEMLKELGVDNYRFSISWPRILPYGRPDYVNPYGVAYYNALIDELLANGITPFVTIYHWELPQNLNEQGGWLNEEIVDWFADYARVLYENFGDRVKHWMTINEPHIHCYFGYGVAHHAPRIFSPGIGYYECGRNILLANAKAYRLYDTEFRSTQGGEVGFVVSMEWAIPESNSQDDLEAVQDFFAFNIGQYMDPIFSENGDYPQRMIDRVQAASLKQGLNASRLRPFTEEEVEFIRGTADFLGLNHYTSRIVYRNESIIGKYHVPSSHDDAYYGEFTDPSWPVDTGFVYEYAPGFYNLMVYIKDTYNNPKIYITENGCSTSTGRNDNQRVQYYRNYLNALLDALAEGVNVKGYFAWSLMDNFEWSFGYTLRFGIYEVDMEDPERTRYPKKSALVYKEIISSRIIDYNYNPDPYTLSSAFRRDASVFVILLLLRLL
ncbi:myrosinase 1-like [Papilio machaon]|uniref:myrosinase 1-like n=1 Tax=Papilio machaon TaxID=76193 RepID=UPI001E663F3D|nr:myrosinase 1-like [Papilio machaon]